MRVAAQAACLTSVETQRVIASIPQVGPADKGKKKSGKENKQLRQEIIDMYEAQRKLSDRIAGDLTANQETIPQANKLAQDNLRRLCGMIKERGWFNSDAIGADAVAAV